MKYVIIIIGFFILQFQLNAQNNAKLINSGTIEYEQVMKLDIQIDGDGSEFASLLPKEQSSKNILYFNQKASLYKSIPKNNDEEMNDDEAGGIVIHIEEPEFKLYTDFVSNTQTEQKEFMTRMFLIESDLDSKGWKLTGNTKELLGFTCSEAVKEDSTQKTTAWFTPEIPVSTGPGHILGLPGAVLAADIDDGQIMLKAVKITPSEVNEIDLEKPNKGKKVTQEEYKKIVDEKMKEMGAEGDGSGKQIIMKIKIDE